MKPRALLAAATIAASLTLVTTPALAAAPSPTTGVDWRSCSDQWCRTDARPQDHNRVWCTSTLGRWQNLDLIEGADERWRLGEIDTPGPGKGAVKSGFDETGRVIFLYRNRGHVGTGGWLTYAAYNEHGHSVAARWKVTADTSC